MNSTSTAKNRENIFSESGLARHYSYFLFDLDGTLTDPKIGITNSILYALDKLGVSETDPKLLEKFIGPPLLESFRKWCGLDGSRARRAITHYREYFAKRGIFENQVYDGMATLLAELHTRGYHLVVATSKPTLYAERILEHFNLRQYFDHVVGSNMDLTRAFKNEIIAEVLRVIPTSRESVIMIGDRADDIMAAKIHMIDSVAVGYGYGSEAELSETKPTYIVYTVGELRSLLLKFTEK